MCRNVWIVVPRSRDDRLGHVYGQPIAVFSTREGAREAAKHEDRARKAYQDWLDDEPEPGTPEHRAWFDREPDYDGNADDHVVVSAYLDPPLDS